MTFKLTCGHLSLCHSIAYLRDYDSLLLFIVTTSSTIFDVSLIYKKLKRSHDPEYIPVWVVACTSTCQHQISWHHDISKLLCTVL